MGLWMLLAWLVPLLLTSLPDIVGVVIGMAVLSGALATFFLSLLRLHRQMVDVKAHEIAIARDLHAEAYEPVRTGPTLEALERQRQLSRRCRRAREAMDALGLIPDERNAKVVLELQDVSQHYFLALAAVLVWRFLRTGGLTMLRAMNAPAEAPGHTH
jgi:hypothetical protein